MGLSVSNESLVIVLLIFIVLKPAFEPPVDNAQHMVQRGLSPFVVPGMSLYGVGVFDLNQSKS